MRRQAHHQSVSIQHLTWSSYSLMKPGLFYGNLANEVTKLESWRAAPCSYLFFRTAGHGGTHMPAKQETVQCEYVRRTHHTHLTTRLPSLGSNCARSEYLGTQV